MEKYVHYTNCDCIDYIRQEGLKPQIGPRTDFIEDTRNGVFLSKGMLNSITMYSAMLNVYNNIIGGDSFYDFLGGYGYCLSINNLDNSKIHNDSDPVDCCYPNTIPPKNINVLVLRNKYDKTIVDSREDVLLYCMNKMIADGNFNLNPRYNVDKCVLYEYLIKNAKGCNIYEYDLEEYSLQFYNCKKHAIKPFVIKPLIIKPLKFI